mmetsp:Transcript_33027/g.73039  ORF Transcript_33027/g.73039 Transcript_33027/m.73039 type:complete len:143 (-) Transcript_33027:795-1223(-)
MATTESQDSMKAFPAPVAGQVRFVHHMPQADDEDSIKVEVIVGKTVETDGNNRHFFAGQLQEENIQGWGFTRYVLKDLGPMAGTLMAMFPGEEKVKKFVQLGGGPELLRYNSRLPIVVYVPEGVEVKVRYWKAGETSPVTQG